MSKPIFTGSIPRGTSQTLLLTVTLDAGGATNLDNLSNVRFLVKRNRSDGDSAAVITKVLIGGTITVTNSGSGLVSIPIAASDTPAAIFNRTFTYAVGLRAYWADGTDEDWIDNAQSTLTVTAGAVQATS